MGFVAAAIAAGTVIPNGTYEIPESDWIDLGYVGSLALQVTYKAVGVPLGQNFLGFDNLLAETDIFASGASANVLCYPEVSIGTGGSTDVFVAPDVFAVTDVFSTSGIVWSAWQKFVPGTYYGRFAKFRMQLAVTDPGITASLVNFAVACSVPTRIDHYQNLTLASGGTSLTFQPDGASTAAPFNAGPNGATLPFVQVTWPIQPGDQLSILSLSKSAVSLQILNGGVGVSRSGVNVMAQGY